MSNGILNLTLILVSIFFFVSGLILSFISFKNENNKNYIIRNHFPYELNAFPATKRNIYGKIAFIISFLSILVFFCIYSFDISKKYMAVDGITGLKLTASITGVLSILSIGYIFLFPMINIKTHLFFDYILFAFAFLCFVSIGFIDVFIFNNKKDPYYLIIGILSFLISLILLILIINPKLKNWAKLDESVNSDGEKIFIRPKFFVLAFTEWVFSFATVGAAIFLVLSFI